MPEDFYDITGRQAGYGDRSQAAGAGLSQGQINRLVAKRQLQRPHPGVYLTGSAPATWEGRVRAAVLAAGGDARTFGRTSARLRGYDGAENHTTIEIAVGVLRGPVPKGVIVHRSRRLDTAGVDHVRGIAVGTVADTLREYAWVTRRGGPQLAERAVEDAIRRAKTNDGALRRYLFACGRGVPGVTALRSVLDGRGDGRPARSGFEVIVFDLIRDAGLRLPVRRELVAVPPDQKYELDLAYVDLMIDIEAMGKKWHSTASQRRRDAERRRVLESLGWLIIEVWWDDAIHRPESVVKKIADAIASRSARI